MINHFFKWMLMRRKYYNKIHKNEYMCVCKNLNKIWKEKGEENIEIGWKKQMFNGRGRSGEGEGSNFME